MSRLPRRLRAELVDRQQGSSAAGRVACQAPFVTMSLQPSGDVYACCRKPAHLLGNITSERLGDLWGNEVGRRLRAAMRRFDLPEGCAVCEWYVRAGAVASADLRVYEHLGADEAVPRWPRRLEFNLANTCNLECLHCSGELSSRIRARRERLPPMPRVYGDAFFEDLDGFLPHLDDAVFLGGEPFLQSECFRIWSRMIELGRPVPCSVTTNGTVCNGQVLEVLAALPVNLSVSLDGARPETVERVRRGAQWHRLMANLDRFREHLGPDGSLRLTFSVLAENWLEVPEFLLLAERYGADVWFNRVTHPAHLGLRALPRAQLLDGLGWLERTSSALVPRLARNQSAWWQFLDLVRRHADDEQVGRLGDRLARTPATATDQRVVLDAKRLVGQGRDAEALSLVLPQGAGAEPRRELLRWQSGAHRRLGNVTAALEAVAAWQVLAPGDWHVHAERAHCLAAAGAIDRSVAELDVAVDRFVTGDDTGPLRDVCEDLLDACPPPAPAAVRAVTQRVGSLPGRRGTAEGGWPATVVTVRRRRGASARRP